MLKRLTAAICAVTMLPGCGVIFGGTRQTVNVTSAPDAAKLTTAPPTGEYTTPTSLSLERKNSYSLRFEREGYKPVTTEVQKSLLWAVIVLDVLFTGLIGIVVDAATGAWYELKPENVTVSMTKLNADVIGPERIDVTLGMKWSDETTAVDVDATAPIKVTITPK